MPNDPSADGGGGNARGSWWRRLLGLGGHRVPDETKDPRQVHSEEGFGWVVDDLDPDHQSRPGPALGTGDRQGTLAPGGAETSRQLAAEGGGSASREATRQGTAAGENQGTGLRAGAPGHPTPEAGQAEGSSHPLAGPAVSSGSGHPGILAGLGAAPNLTPAHSPGPAAGPHPAAGHGDPEAIPDTIPEHGPGPDIQPKPPAGSAGAIPIPDPTPDQIPGPAVPPKPPEPHGDQVPTLGPTPQNVPGYNVPPKPPEPHGDQVPTLGPTPQNVPGYNVPPKPPEPHGDQVPTLGPTPQNVPGYNVPPKPPEPHGDQVPTLGPTPQNVPGYNVPPKPPEPHGDQVPTLGPTPQTVPGYNVPPKPPEPHGDQVPTLGPTPQNVPGYNVPPKPPEPHGDQVPTLGPTPQNVPGYNVPPKPPEPHGDQVPTLGPTPQAVPGYNVPPKPPEPHGDQVPTLGPTPQNVPGYNVPPKPPEPHGDQVPTLGPTPQNVPGYNVPPKPPEPHGDQVPTLGPTPQTVPGYNVPPKVPPTLGNDQTPDIVPHVAQISGTDTGTMTEDRDVTLGNLTADGHLTIADPDAGEAAFAPVTAGIGAYGTFTLDTQGNWTYTADNAQLAVQALQAGAVPLTDTLTVTSVDGTKHDIIVTIHGTNDAPVLSAATASATEDGSAVTGRMSATDVDSGDTKAFSIGQPVDGFTLQADGSWSFDPSHAAYQHLAAGQTMPVTIPVTVTDSAGATDTENLVITVTGTNDAPVVSGPVDLGSGTEDKAVPITAAQLLAHATDIDTGDHLSVTGLTASHGTISGDAAHGFTFTPDPNYNGPVDLSYQVTDGHGGSVAQTASLTLGATPDAAVITGGDTGSMTEDRNVGPSSAHPLAVSGSLSVQDPDGPSQEFFQYSRFGEHAISDPFGGSLHIDRAGNWDYEVDNTHHAVQALAAGEEGHAIYEVHSADGTAHRIQITIHGTNDAPVLSVATASATEDGSAVTGQMSATDVDTGDTKAFAIAQPVDGFTMHGDGSWSFDPSHAAYQHLAAGQTMPVTIPVTVTDSAGATDTENLVITVTGTNDAPVVSGPVDLGSGTEDKAVPITAAQLLAHATDIDTGDHLSVTGLTASHGTISGDAAHGFTFTPDPNYNGPVDLSYQVTDGHGGSVAQTASLTLGATPDAAVITGGDTGSMTEDRNVGPSSAHPLAVSGSLSVQDPDGPSQEFFQYSRFGEHAISDPFGGSLHIDRAGNWDYEVDNTHHAVQALAAGEEGHAIYEVHSADGTAHRIQITIHGTNDAPVLSVATASATEDGSAVTGQMSATDVDTGDSKAFSIGQPVDGFTLQADGSWSFDPSHAAYQHLAAGQTMPVTIPVTVTDSAGATDTENLVITVTGTNDAPVVSGPVSLPGGKEDQAVSITAAQLLAHATDIDTGDHLSVTGLTASHGTISGDAAHGFTFTPDPNYNGPVDLSYQVTDGHGGSVPQTASLSLGATPDAAVITGGDTGSVTEDSTLVTGGKLDVADPDQGQAALVPQTGVAGTHGTFTVQADGTWSYQLDNAQPAVQALQAGGTPLTDTLTVSSIDGTTHDITVAIEGTNDGPQVQPGDLGATQQDQSRTFTESELLQRVHATDIDRGDTLTIDSVSVDPKYGSFARSAGGDWEFRPAAGVAHDDIPVSIVVRDSAGATRAAQADLDITPAPVAAQVQGVGTQHLSGTIAGAPGGWAIATATGAGVLSLQGQYGTLTIDPQTGHFDYHYTPDSAVIKHGGTGAAPGIHIDTFKIMQHGGTVADAEVEVKIDVQSVHGQSGHHIDHTQLQGITLVPIAPVQHDAPGDEAVEEVSVHIQADDQLADIGAGLPAESEQLAEMAPHAGQGSGDGPVDHYLGAIDRDVAAQGDEQPSYSTEAQDPVPSPEQELSPLSGTPVTAEGGSQATPVDHYLAAVGDTAESGAAPQHEAQVASYLQSAGVDPQSAPMPPPDMHAGLPDPTLTADGSLLGAADQDSQDNGNTPAPAPEADVPDTAPPPDPQDDQHHT
ncbi:VCBS domain-containing protein [Roseibium sp. Sym1]|uniref:VCBS domain-containing protein n=1 Tax=Roseibium sp. Sym1 TaxID=3016006 RepID=UPI0022B571F2|nr:VCBS domain-containing protein [Roseibium sp. Sym1]